MPVDEKGVDGERLGVAEAGQKRFRGSESNESRPQRAGFGRGAGDIERDLAVRREYGSRHSSGEQIQSIIVIAKQFRCAGECVDNSRPELVFERGDDGVTDSHSRECRVVVVRVVPGFNSLCRAGREGRFACDVEKRSTDDPVERGHPPNAPRAGATGESQDHRFRLIVSGVPGQHHRRTNFGRDAHQAKVAGLARGRFWPTVRPHVDLSNENGLESTGSKEVCSSFGDLGGCGLESVVNYGCGDSYPALGADELSCNRERHGIGPTADGDEHG